MTSMESRPVDMMDPGSMGMMDPRPVDMNGPSPTGLMDPRPMDMRWELEGRMFEMTNQTIEGLLPHDLSRVNNGSSLFLMYGPESLILGQILAVLTLVALVTSALFSCWGLVCVGKRLRTSADTPTTARHCFRASSDLGSVLVSGACCHALLWKVFSSAAGVYAVPMLACALVDAAAAVAVAVVSTENAVLLSFVAFSGSSVTARKSAVVKNCCWISAALWTLGLLAAAMCSMEIRLDGRVGEDADYTGEMCNDETVGKMIESLRWPVVVMLCSEMLLLFAMAEKIAKRSSWRRERASNGILKAVEGKGLPVPKRQEKQRSKGPSCPPWLLSLLSKLSESKPRPQCHVCGVPVSSIEVACGHNNNINKSASVSRIPSQIVMGMQCAGVACIEDVAESAISSSRRAAGDDHDRHEEDNMNTWPSVGNDHNNMTTWSPANNNHNTAVMHARDDDHKSQISTDSLVIVRENCLLNDEALLDLVLRPAESDDPEDDALIRRLRRSQSNAASVASATSAASVKNKKHVHFNNGEEKMARGGRGSGRRKNARPRSKKHRREDSSSTTTHEDSSDCGSVCDSCPHDNNNNNNNNNNNIEDEKELDLAEEPVSKGGHSRQARVLPNAAKKPIQRPVALVSGHRYRCSEDSESDVIHRMSSVEEVVEEEDEDAVCGAGVFPDGLPPDDVVSVTSHSSTSSEALRTQVERVREISRLKAQEVSTLGVVYACILHQLLVFFPVLVAFAADAALPSPSVAVAAFALLLMSAAVAAPFVRAVMVAAAARLVTAVVYNRSRGRRQSKQEEDSGVIVS